MKVWSHRIGVAENRLLRENLALPTHALELPYFGVSIKNASRPYALDLHSCLVLESSQSSSEFLRKFFPKIMAKLPIWYFITHYSLWIVDKNVGISGSWQFHPIAVLQLLEYLIVFKTVIQINNPSWCPLPLMYVVFPITVFHLKECHWVMYREKLMSLVPWQHCDSLWISHVHIGARKGWRSALYRHNCSLLKYTLPYGSPLGVRTFLYL